MKKTINKIWGIGLTLVILASLFMFAGPAAPVAAGTLAWSNQAIPSALTNQLAPNTDVAFVTVAPNGDIFAVDNETALANVLYKSTTGGRTWTATKPYTAASAPWTTFGQDIVAIAVSPAYATDGTVFVLSANTTASQVYWSNNGGTTFGVLGGNLLGAKASSIAVAPNYAAGVGEIMVGTDINVYIWGKNGTLNWTPTGLTDPVTSVAYSSFYQIDGTRLAVSANASGTMVNTLVAGELNWNGTIGPGNSNQAVAVVDATITAPTSSVILVPSDFNSTSQFTRTVYVALASAGGADDVYRVTVGVATGAVDLEPFAAVLGPNGDNQVTSLAYSGTCTAGTLYAAASLSNVCQVMFTTGAPTASDAVAPSWSRTYSPPTGTTAPYVALAKDYASSNKVYVGTGGTDSALSVSTDGGLYYYQAGLIATEIKTVTDIKTPTATDFYLATNDAAGTTQTSLWRSLDSGASWYRILSLVATNGILRYSPNYATDSTIVFGQVNGTTLKVSNNKGSSWNILVSASPVAIGDIAIKDQYTFYIGSNASAAVATTLNGGYYFAGPATGTAITGASGKVSSLRIDVASGHLLAGTDTGEVHYSTDGNTTWTQIRPALTSGTTLIAFDAKYNTNKTVYAVSDGDAGVKRWVVGTSTSWTRIDNTLITAANVGDILTTPDGALYVSDDTTPSNGMYRSNNPTFGLCVPGDAASFPNWNAIGTGQLPAFNNVTLSYLSWVSGSNVIYAVDKTNDAVHTYTDTLTTAAPVQTAPAEGEILDDNSALFMWNAVPGAQKYEVQYCSRADWSGATSANTSVTFDTMVGSGALIRGVTYYWRVRANAPLFSQWSQTRSMVAQMSTAEPNAPAIGGVAAGGTASGGYNAPLVPTFTWGPAKAAIGYYFQLATDSSFSADSLLVDIELGDVNAYQLSGLSLEYSSTYYWRVQGITATSTSDWSAIAVFTTLAKPTTTATATGTGTTTIVNPTPTVTFTMPDITVPTPTVTVLPGDEEPAKQIAPAYIWAIIIIGAILVIAVIVLIVRTRRSV